MTMYRQGDVLIERVDESTETVVKAKNIELDTQKGSPRVVFAYGEVTGHAHAIAYEESMDWFEAEGQDTVTDAGGTVGYLRLVDAAELRHEEHSPINLDPGLWKVTRQREYTPERIRSVAD
jgi:hypothetical protein